MKIKIHFKILMAFIILIVCSGTGMLLHAENSMVRIPVSNEEHNWKQSSVDYHIIEVGEHEFSYWKNFMKHSRTCNISHRIKTVVYYCDIHGHTKSETTLEKVLHSENHHHE